MRRLLVAALLGVALAAEVEDAEPPVISLELAGLGVEQIASDPASGAPCHSKAEWMHMGNPQMASVAPESCDIDPAAAASAQYAKRCEVLTDSKTSCPEPRAHAFDHHDGRVEVKKHVDTVLNIKHWEAASEQR